MADRVLLLWPKATYRAEDFLAAAKRLGVEVLVGSDRCHEIAKLWPTGEEPYYQAVPLDFRHVGRAVKQIERLVAEQPVRTIVPTDDTTSVIAAHASARLGLPGNPPQAAEAARNKKRLRELLQAAGVPSPRHRAVPIDADPRTLEVALPCVLKPLHLSASRGVIRADDREGLAAAFARVTALLRDPEVTARDPEAAREVLIEEFIPGVEVAVEGLLDHGPLRVLALFDKPDPLDGPYFEETLYVTPSRLPQATQDEITATTARAAAALGLRDGPIHAELRVPPCGGAVVIEVAARSIGGLCSRTLRFGAGLSLEEVILSHALGRSAELARERQAAGVMMLPIPRRGVLREVRGVADAAAVPGIEGVEITAPLGHELFPLPEGSSYLGFVFARGASPDTVEAALREAHRRLAFDITPVLERVR